MKTMRIWRIAFAMLAAFSLVSCRQSAQKAEAEQQEHPKIKNLFLT